MEHSSALAGKGHRPRSRSLRGSAELSDGVGGEVKEIQG